MKANGISVVICCYNSAQRLEKTLNHLIRQQFSIKIHWEIIVVDNASTDKTNQIAHHFLLPSETDYQIVNEQIPGQSHARRKGFESAKYNLLLFCDDDNWLSETYVQRAYELMNEHPEIGMLGGWGIAAFEHSEPFWFQKFQQNFAVGPQSESPDPLSRVELVYGAGCTIRHELLQRIYAPDITLLLSGRTGKKLMSGDDNEWCYMVRFMGHQIAFSRELKFQHFMPATRMKWDYLKKLYIGFGRTNLYAHAYQFLFLNDNLPRTDLRLPFWFDTYIHRWKNLISHYKFIRKKRNLIGDEDILRYYGMLGELKELRSLRNKYIEIYKIALNNRKRLQKDHA